MLSFFLHLKINLVLLIAKVPKTIQGAKTRYGLISRKYCFHLAQTVRPLKIPFPFHEESIVRTLKKSHWNTKKIGSLGLFSITISLSLLLSACGETTVDSSGLSRYRGNTYEMQIPASWENIPTTELVAPVRGTIELALRSQVNKRGFMNNLTILSDDTYTDATSSEYLRQSVLWASKEYLQTTVESQEAFDFSDGEPSSLAIYRAKYNEVTEERLFFQTARLCGKRVYLLTLGLENDTTPENYDRYRSLLATFTCK